MSSLAVKLLDLEPNQNLNLVDLLFENQTLQTLYHFKIFPFLSYIDITQYYIWNQVGDRKTLKITQNQMLN